MLLYSFSYYRPESLEYRVAVWGQQVTAADESKNA